MREYMLYVKVENQAPQTYITPCFEVDQVFWKEREGCRLYVIGKSPSLAMAFYLRGQLNERLKGQPVDEASVEGLRRLAHDCVREANGLYGRETKELPPFRLQPAASAAAAWEPGEDWQRRVELLARLLSGRALLWEEAESLLQKHGACHGDIVSPLQWLALRGDLVWLPGIQLDVHRGWWKHRLHMTCRRCGSEDAILLTVCHSCGQGCAYCHACLGMGRSKCCTPYLCMPAKPALREQVASPLRWSGTYSPLQAEAAERARQFVSRNEAALSAFLIWAVCGAGKTELIFPAMEEMLGAGGQVLIATPRKDVVLELAPRLQKAFPVNRVIAVHGSSPDKWEEGDIFIATTHQVMRYYRKFPLVVVDEVDAFPFHNNKALYHAVARAVMAEGKLLYLSATPPRYLQKTLVSRSLINPSLHSNTHVLLPKRYHGHPLPVPKAVVTRKPVPRLLDLIRTSFQRERQVFVFVPRVEDVARVLADIKRWLPEHAKAMEGVHAADPGREQKVLRFREKRSRLLVTTTILERGVTIPRSDVAVLGADAPVFDEASLVQIAGRVGRSADAPGGTVLFLMQHRAHAPYAAIRQIKTMNALAGRIKEGAEDAG
ncbi:DEAD/DEAH box helicase [Brevibacillus sp. H7]|uniref:DEAD/DEAH box helicase n=1 Tax=Brevibacillus sp. H7 TaxID=3349138 RepID=UPI0037F58EC7